MREMIDFSKVRHVDGTQHAGFEELCCQLAEHAADQPPGSTFYRKAGVGGDEGVEYYSSCQTGRSGDGKPSTFTADSGIRSGNRLTAPCAGHLNVIPVSPSTWSAFRDLSGQRGKGGKTQLDKWQEYVQKWEDVARRESMSVTFKFWGKHEIVDRLEGML